MRSLAPTFKPRAAIHPPAAAPQREPRLIEQPNIGNGPAEKDGIGRGFPKKGVRRGSQSV